MLVNHSNYGEAIMGIAFVKLLERKLPNWEAISPQVQAVAQWIYDNQLTDGEKQEVRDAGLLE